MTNFGEVYFDHYEKHFLNHSQCHAYQSNKAEPSIQVLVYDGVFRSCQVFATLGVCHYAKELGGVNEIVVAVDGFWDDIPYILASSMFYLIQHHTELRRGTLVGGIENICPEFYKETKTSSIYITEPFDLPPDFSTVDCFGKRGAVLWGIFLTQSERDFLRRVGVEAFESALEASNLDPYRLRRPSVI